MREQNQEVQLAYTTEKWNEDLKPMIVLHGLLGSSMNWKQFVRNAQISSKRNAFLVEQRNHALSDHHDDMNYEVLSDDLIRFADNRGLD